LPDRTLKVVFMGSPEFALPTLDSLVSAPRFDVAQVVTQPDRPKGRGKRLAPTAVKAYSLRRGIPVATMTKQDYAAVVEDLRRVETDFVVVASFGIILRRDLLDLPAMGCVNLHASLLPRHRGMSPIQAAILAGDEATGCTTMLMDEGVDTGAILLAESVPVDSTDTAGTLERKLAALGGPLVIRTLEGLADGTVRPTPQDEREATRTQRIRKENGLIDWKRGAGEIERLVRAMQPWPTAHTMFSGKRLIVLGAAVLPDASGEPGVVLSAAPLVVAAGLGAIEIRRLKMEGKNETTAKSFVAGHKVERGFRFE
jgi:methionyl-tRNA formyltransferase